MTIKGLLIASFFMWLLEALIKIVYFNNNLFLNQFWVYVYFILIAVISAAIVRRLGNLNYLEAGVVSLAWLTLLAFFDYTVTNHFLPVAYFSHTQALISYIMIVLTIFFFAWVNNTGLVLGFAGALILFLFLDSVLGGRFSTANLSFQNQTWAGYGVMMLTVILFHKKRHIQIRKELHAKHGSQHH